MNIIQAGFILYTHFIYLFFTWFKKKTKIKQFSWAPECIVDTGGCAHRGSWISPADLLQSQNNPQVS